MPFTAEDLKALQDALLPGFAKAIDEKVGSLKTELQSSVQSLGQRVDGIIGQVQEITKASLTEAQKKAKLDEMRKELVDKGFDAKGLGDAELERAYLEYQDREKKKQTDVKGAEDNEKIARLQFDMSALKAEQDKLRTEKDAEVKLRLDAQKALEEERVDTQLTQALADAGVLAVARSKKLFRDNAKKDPATGKWTYFTDDGQPAPTFMEGVLKDIKLRGDDHLLKPKGADKTGSDSHQSQDGNKGTTLDDLKARVAETEKRARANPRNDRFVSEYQAAVNAVVAEEKRMVAASQGKPDQPGK